MSNNSWLVSFFRLTRFFDGSNQFCFDYLHIFRSVSLNDDVSFSFKVFLVIKPVISLLVASFNFTTCI